MRAMSPATAALIRERRFGLAGTYGLTVAENLCMLAYPTLTGQAVDQLLQRRYEGTASSSPPPGTATSKTVRSSPAPPGTASATTTPSSCASTRPRPTALNLRGQPSARADTPASHRCPLSHVISNPLRRLGR